MNTESEADSLINSLLDSNITQNQEKKEKVETLQGNNYEERYQLPVQVGIGGKPLSDGDRPWVVGHFSPNAPTDINHKFHNGVDLKAVKGTPVYPIASGVVKDVGSGGISGNYVTCLHENGNVQSFYGHLESIRASKGQKVTQSTPIGTVGETGNAKGRGAHLHYEVKVNGSLVNPLSIPGKAVGSLTKKASLLTTIHKLADKFELLSSLEELPK